MKRTSLWILAAIVVALLASSLVWNFSMRAAPRPGQVATGRGAAGNHGIDNFDIREKTKDAVLKFERRMEKLSSKQKEKNANLKLAMEMARERKAGSGAELEVTFSDLTNSPEVVVANGGGRKFLTPPSSLSRDSVLRGFLNGNSELFGMDPQQVARLRKIAEYTNPNGNLSWVRMEQRWNGMKVFGGEIMAAFTSDGALVRTVGGLTPGPDEQDLATTPQVKATAAVVAAAASVGVTLAESDLAVKASSLNGRAMVFHPVGPFTQDIEPELIYFPLGPGVATPAWSMILWQGNPAYYMLIDAGTGDLLWLKNITNDQTQSATYSVYNDDNPAPLSPTTALPGSGIQGAAIPRTLFTLISELPAFDNLGWINDDVNTTTGNNVDAGLDIVAPDGIDPNGRAVGNPSRVFDFPYNPAPGIPPPGEAPTLANYRNGAVTNLFFWSNRYHDRLYELGFTEASRNFQQDNFSRGGIGNDRVLAQAQDFSGTNNANFATPPDGISGRMQMYIFSFPVPNRDGDLDQEIVLHELTHGTSNRLHANATGLNTILSAGMGEGWSDYYARALLSTADEDVNGLYASGGYSTFQLSVLGNNNYYYGIRRFPYAVKTTVGPNGKPHNPLTFADTDPDQLDTSDGAFPESPLGFSFNGANEPHNVGEIWCMTLLEMRARLINRLGFDDGNQRALQLVTDGMKLDPVNPNLLQGRDSILLADCAGFGGSDEMDIWAGFAARGMGFSAKYNSASSVTEAFDTPNLTLGGVTFTDNSCSADAFADPGDPLTLNIPLNNPFCATAANGVSISVNGGGSVSYGDIPAGAAMSQSVPFTVPSDAVCGSQLTLNAVITSSLGTVTRTFNLRIGKPSNTVSANYSSGNLAVPIPTVGNVDIPINVTDVGAVADVNVRVRLNHTFDFDVVLMLIAPDGTTVRLVDNRGGAGDNFGTGANDCSGVPTIFDDSASTPIGAGLAPFAGTFRPETPLSALNGKNANGVWRLRATDVFPPEDDGTLGCITLEINRQLFTCNVPVTTVASVTGQYSDVVQLKANVTNVTCPGTVEFKVNGSVVGSAQFANGMATLPYKITLAQGNYPIVATYTSTPPDKTSSGSGTLSVTREDALVTPAASNPTVVKVNSPRGTAGPINLCAAVNETNDESPGDIALATPVTFTLTPLVSGGQAITQTATTSGGGVGGTLMACAALNNVPVNVYIVGISVGGNNYTGSGVSALAVFDPALGSFKGIGTVVHNGRNGTFMLNVKYKRDGTPQGGLLYAERRPTGFVVLQASSVQSLSIVGNTGVIFGKASVNGVANHTFRATVVDSSKSGRGDRFGLQVISPSGAIVPDLTFDPITLKGGNIKR